MFPSSETVKLLVKCKMGYDIDFRVCVRGVGGVESKFTARPIYQWE